MDMQVDILKILEENRKLVYTFDGGFISPIFQNYYRILILTCYLRCTEPSSQQLQF